MMKRGAKRPALDSSDPDLRSTRVLDSPFLNAHRAEPEPSVARAPPLDPKRAALSQQHVRALNTQFASWVQLQLQNHPDELWEDGAKDYISHASHIMEKFKDVVDWLRENAAKSGSASTSDLPNEKTNFITVSQNNKPQFRADINNGFAQATTSSTISSFQNSGSLFGANNSKFPPSSQGAGSFPTSQSSSLFSSSQSSNLFSTQQRSSLFSTPQSSSLFSTPQSSGLFSTPQSSGFFPNSQSSGFLPGSQSSGLVSSSQSSGLVSSSQSTGLFPSSQSSGLVFSSQSAGLFPSSQSSGLVSSSQNTSLFPSSQSSGLVSSSQSLFSSSQSSGLFSWSQTPALPVTQAHTFPRVEVAEDADEEDESEKPSSPSLKKAEEKGVVVVHEVKCKVYIKQDNSAEKSWKDIGVGQLSIKCREGADKATKESKPTIVIRNDVGRILLNALIYPGIKMNIQKKTVASIFHTSGGNANGTETDNTDAAVARTYLFRLRTEEEATELASTIKEYAPS